MKKIVGVVEGEQSEGYLVDTQNTSLYLVRCRQRAERRSEAELGAFVDDKCTCGGLCLLPLENDVSGQILSLDTRLYLGGVFAFLQVGSTNSTVPSAPAYNSNEFWSSLSPAGLSDVVKQLCDALRPHLNRR